MAKALILLIGTAAAVVRVGIGAVLVYHGWGDHSLNGLTALGVGLLCLNIRAEVNSAGK